MTLDSFQRRKRPSAEVFIPGVQVLIVCLLCVAMAAPQTQGVPRAKQLKPEARQQDVDPNNFLKTLRDDRSPVIGPNFTYLYETENKIFEERKGFESSEEEFNMEGTYRWETPEGKIIEVRYEADEDGFRAKSDAIPAWPAHALEQIRIAKEQRAAGIRWDDKGFRI